MRRPTNILSYQKQFFIPTYIPKTLDLPIAKLVAVLSEVTDSDMDWCGDDVEVEVEVEVEVGLSILV